VETRLDYGTVLPVGMEPIRALSKYARECGLEPSLLELVYLRASQINGCAYCVDMHTKDARTKGETEQRLYGVSVWRETPFFTERERAALAFTEAVTLISQDHVPDDVYGETRRHFSEEEMVKLVLVIVSINAWNRFAITFRNLPGTYQPDHFVARGEKAAATKGR